MVIADGVATITTPTGVVTLAASGDGLICGPCALARWLHVLNLTAVYSDRCVIDSVIARGAPLSANSPHLCDGPAVASDSTARLLLLPPIDRWGLISAVSAPRSSRDGRPASRRRAPRSQGHAPASRRPQHPRPLTLPSRHPAPPTPPPPPTARINFANADHRCGCGTGVTEVAEFIRADPGRWRHLDPARPGPRDTYSRDRGA